MRQPHVHFAMAFVAAVVSFWLSLFSKTRPHRCGAHGPRSRRDAVDDHADSAIVGD